MISSKTVKTTAKSGGFSLFASKGTNINLKKVLTILGLFMLVPFVYRYFKSQFVKNQEQDNELEKDKKWLLNSNATTQQQRADKITKFRELQTVAKQLAHDLGTLYSDQNSWLSWTNYKGWTENDEEVKKALIKWRLYYPTLKRLYSEVYSNSRNLTTDVVSLLDKDDLTELRKHIKLT